MTNAIIPAKQPADVTKFIPYGSAEEIKLSVKLVQELIAVPTKSGQTCSQRDALRFIAMCQAKRLNPYESDAYLIGYDGKDGPQFSLITAHQAYLKRAELHPEFDGMESGVVVTEGEDGEPKDIQGDFFTEGQTVVGGWARVHFKNRKVPIYRRVRLSRFRKSYGVWADDPGGMICKVAEADALRSAFPTMLGGLFLREEVEINVSPSNSNGAVDNSRFVSVVSQAASDRGQQASDEAAEAAAGLAPEQPRTPPQDDAPSSVAVLQNIVTNLGHTFTTFARWAGESGSLADADSLTGWDDIKQADAERLLKVFRGTKARQVVLPQLEQLKASGVV